MQSHVIGFAADSISAAILHLIPFVALTWMLAALLIRSSTPATASTKVKARREPESRPVRKKQHLTVVEVPRSIPKQNARLKPELLSEGVLRFLKEAETRKGLHEVAQNEESLIRQKDMAAEFLWQTTIKRAHDRESYGGDAA